MSSSILTGKKVALYFVLFFAVVATVDALMVTMAVRTHSGIVTDHPYEKGLAYNNVVEAQEAQHALGWKSTLDYKNGVLQFALRDKNNAPIIPEESVATITRPTQSGMDFTMQLTGERTPLSFPASGLWEVRVDAVYQGVHYQQTKRIVVP